MSESKSKVLTEEQVAFFHENGYLVLNNFISAAVAEEMRKQASDYMDEFEKDTGIPIHLFTTDADQASQRTAYFQNSVRGIWPFFEEKAIDPSNKSLRYPYKQCINKIGHELHGKEGVFKRVTHQAICREICEELGVSNPIVPQSMYILKEARVGAEVSPHQDSSFLYTEPKPTCTAFWIPLEDATVENGCLWIVPKSHRGEIKTRFVMQEDGEGAKFDPNIGDTWLVWPKDTFTPLPAATGSLVLLHGSLVHMSLENLSDKPRHVYTWHVVSSDQTYSPLNWMGTGPFAPL